ncbi:MAG: hypothetical protein LBL66_10895 [Clostridiales bacterium]|jgi:hypothetical protein|nr:hypothetical protein [Clostridiales bacterium]
MRKDYCGVVFIENGTVIKNVEHHEGRGLKTPSEYLRLEKGGIVQLRKYFGTALQARKWLDTVLFCGLAGREKERAE